MARPTEAQQRQGLTAPPTDGGGLAGSGSRMDTRDEAALLELVRTYPVGRRVEFGSYSPGIWDRWWRRSEAANSNGLRAGDVLTITGYGATCRLPEALLVARQRDGVEALVFPADLASSAD